MARAKRVLQGLAILAIGVWIYWPALRGDWLWDDDLLVTNNLDLRSLGGLWKIWFASPTTDYWPLTWSLLWIEWHFWGNHPLGFHLCSLTLHLFSGFLIWHIFGRLGMRWAWLGALLFVIHPLAVESVAWIAETKNTLSLPFFLLSFDAWLDLEEKKPAGYLKSVLYYLVAMLCKTSTAMLPVVILLYVWWKRERVARQEILRMVPYAAVALALGLLTVYFQTHGTAPNRIQAGGFLTRSIGAGTALFFYLGKFFLPFHLLAIYPRWPLEPPSVWEILTIPATAGLLAFFWSQRKTWGRHALFGFGFFLINVLPVLGLVKMRWMAISWVADHLVYLPMIGLIGLLVGAADEAARRAPAFMNSYGLAIIAVAAGLLTWKSRGDSEHYFSQETLWTYTLEHNSRASLAHNNLGIAFAQRGHMQWAIAQFQQAVKTDPNNAEAHYNLGYAPRANRPDLGRHRPMRAGRPDQSEFGPGP